MMLNNSMLAEEAAAPVSTEAEDKDAITLAKFTSAIVEIEQQPAWRGKADREMDYLDGNQLDSEILQAQRAIGMPPAIENVIGPAIAAVTGMEVKMRKDWRVVPDTKIGGDDVAEALSFKLNQAERHSKADRACSEAYRHQVSVGLGWVEVARESNPFKYPYRTTFIHRNEIWWDWLDTEPELEKARYLVRRRWTDMEQAVLMFPDKAEVIRHSSKGWQGIDFGMGSHDGGGSTDLARAQADERGWSIEEMQWRDIENNRVCLFEVWYRVWVRTLVMKMPDGRVIEVDQANEAHQLAIGMGMATPTWVVLPKMRTSMWLGPHRLADGPTPYPHQKFPYVAFFGMREDRTMVPYGLIRGMMYQQDSINATTGKIRWGLSSVRTIRTAGAYAGTDEQFRQQVARVDADIVLDADAMSQPGAKFEVERDFNLSEQQYKMLGDARTAIERTSGITPSFQGQRGTATSGIQESTQVEQSVQALADINDNFDAARTQVGDLLMSLIVEDMIGVEETVLIDGMGLKPDKTVMLNAPVIDQETGIKMLDNDVERTKLKVTLEDVPSTPSFQAQQLGALSEAFKSMGQQYQPVVLPHLLSLMNIPNKAAIIEGVKQAAQQQSEEQIQQRIKDAVVAAGLEIRERELALKYPAGSSEAKDALIRAQAVEVGVKAAFAAIQTAGAIVQTPQISPVADEVMRLAGYQTPNPVGVDPNYPMPGQSMPAVDPALAGDFIDGVPPVQQNTSPALPPVPQQPGSPMQGIETQRQDSAPTNQEGQP
jgi:hypothetical protein